MIFSVWLFQYHRLSLYHRSVFLGYPSTFEGAILIVKILTTHFQPPTSSQPLLANATETWLQRQSALDPKGVHQIDVHLRLRDLTEDLTKLGKNRPNHKANWMVPMLDPIEIYFTWENWWTIAINWGIHMDPPFLDQRMRGYWESRIFGTRISKLRQVVLVLLNLILLPPPLQLDQTCLPDENMELDETQKIDWLQMNKKHSVHIKAASTWVVTASSSPTSLSTCAQSHMRWSMDLSPRNGTWWHMETEGSSKSLQNLSTTRKIENQWHVQAVKPPPIDRPAKSASEAAQAPSENQEMTLDFEVQNGSTNHLMLSNAI